MSKLKKALEKAKQERESSIGQTEKAPERNFEPDVPVARPPEPNKEEIKPFQLKRVNLRFTILFYYENYFY